MSLTDIPDCSDDLRTAVAEFILLAREDAHHALIEEATNWLAEYDAHEGVDGDEFYLDDGNAILLEVREWINEIQG